MFHLSKEVKESTVKTKNLKNGEKAECKVDGLEIEKVDNETFVLNTKKGSMKKVR